MALMTSAEAKSFVHCKFTMSARGGGFFKTTSTGFSAAEPQKPFLTPGDVNLHFTHPSLGALPLRQTYALPSSGQAAQGRRQPPSKLCRGSRSAKWSFIAEGVQLFTTTFVDVQLNDASNTFQSPSG